MLWGRTIQIRAAHDAQELGVNGHTGKHAHAASTRVAGGDTADSRADCAQSDTSDLASRCDALATLNRNFQHEPVRQHVPAYLRLSKHVRAFEVK